MFRGVRTTLLKDPFLTGENNIFDTIININVTVKLPGFNSASHDSAHLDARRCEKFEIGRANKREANVLIITYRKNFFVSLIFLYKRRKRRKKHIVLCHGFSGIWVGGKNWMELLCP